VEQVPVFFSSAPASSSFLFTFLNQLTFIMPVSFNHHVQIKFDQSHYQTRLYQNYFAHNLLNRYPHPLNLQKSFFPALPKRDPLLTTFYD
jgi:hypothetical protein